MSEKRVSHLRVSTKEAQIITKWFDFQEKSHPGTDTTITNDDIELLRSIKKCLKKISEEPDKYVAVRLTPKYCEIALNWFSNIPECVADKSDADIHASLGTFLEEFYSE
jgi:hypothetical protein